MSVAQSILKQMMCFQSTLKISVDAFSSVFILLVTMSKLKSLQNSSNRNIIL